MGTLRHQSVEAMRQRAEQLAIARIDSVSLGVVTPEALVMASMFEHSQVAPAGRNTKNGARSSMHVMWEAANRKADGEGELTWDHIYPPMQEEFRASE